MGLGDQVERADLIVEGRVVARRSVERADGRIDTHLTLRIDHTFLGEHEDARVVTVPGGVLEDGRGMLVPGFRLPGVGDEMVWLFTPEGPSSVRVPVGLDLGQVRLVRDADGRRLAISATGCVATVDPLTGSAVPAGDGSVRPYAELLSELEAAVARRRASSGGGR